MDDQNQQSGQGIQPQQPAQEQTLVQFPQSSNSAAHPQNQVPTQPQSVPPPSTPPAKEQEPLPSPATTEWIAPSEKSVEIEPEVERAGVKETSAALKLSTEEKIAGLEEAMESVPVQKAPVQKIHYPIPIEDAEKEVKGPLIFKNTGNAMLWLAMLVIRQFKMKGKKEQ